MRHKAFTFVELLIVIIIIGILFSVSLPSFRKAFNNLQADNFAGQLQNFMNYLHQRSIVEERIVYLNIDNKNKKYWAQVKDSPLRVKTYSIPEGIEVLGSQEQVFFYPDGQIDKVDITLTNSQDKCVFLTTKGVFGGVKILSEK